jgi:hypothetical protein
VHYHIARHLKDEDVIDMGGTGKLNEICKAQITNANLKNGQDCCNLNYGSKSFDAAVSIATLEHVKSHSMFLKESIRLAKRFIMHWFPFGDGACEADELKRSLGWPHECEYPSSVLIDKYRQKYNLTFYPLLAVCEHLLILAAHFPKLNTQKLHEYVFRNYQNDKPYGYILMGEL